MIMRGLLRYVEDLVRSRRPRRFRATEADTSLARAAMTLRTARAGSGAPRDEFVTALHKRLAAELDPPVRRHAAGARRAFLRNAAVVSGAAVAGAGIDRALTAHSLTGPAAAPPTMIPEHGTWHTVTASADLPNGSVCAFTTGEVTGFVERAGGRLVAVSGICTHQGCKLALATQPVRLICPCHGATFALDGAVLGHRFPATLPALPRIEVREVGGEVQVYATTPTGTPPHPSASDPDGDGDGSSVSRRHGKPER
jgi:nitrite reductase/ring-hydroxylating ferredoxin subunit